MKCIKVRQNLDAILDGEINLSEREMIESHLENCVSCQVESENLEIISNSLKQTLPIAASAFLDEKILNAFQSHYIKKQPANAEEKQEKIGWFGIPRFAFAAAFILLALISGLAFQLGRMSAANVEISNNQNLSSDDSDKKPTVQKFSNEKDKASETKIVEVPVIREKIVKVPVIKEKIVTRIIYVEKESKKDNRTSPTVSPQNILALNNSVKDGEFLTQTNLKDFQPVLEIKAKITKKDEKNEN